LQPQWMSSARSCGKGGWSVQSIESLFSTNYHPWPWGEGASE
jgi:hypothetical protein